jgi:exodeoxyribonuclease VII small subunit
MGRVDPPNTLCNACAPPERDVTTRKSKTPDFEQALEELEAAVERLERGDLPLEDALKQFERGIALSRGCQTALKQAEQKVEILLKKTPEAAPEPFEPEEE